MVWAFSFQVLLVRYSAISFGLSDGEIRFLYRGPPSTTLGDRKEWAGFYLERGGGQYIRLHVPLWAPFALSLVYPAALVVFMVARRWVRRRRGCCLGCGYDLRGCVNYVCPECGRSRGYESQS